MVTLMLLNTFIIRISNWTLEMIKSSVCGSMKRIFFISVHKIRNSGKIIFKLPLMQVLKRIR